MMFFEYALAPGLLTNWKDFRYFVEKFGWPQGRLISRYPKHWKRLVYEALSGCRDVEKSRIVERLNQIDDRILKRPNQKPYQKDKSWLENVIVEHDRLAFRAIISQEGDHDRPFLAGDTLDENELLWQSPNRVVIRKAEEFSATLDLLLISSKKLKIIDPYFDPQKQRFTRVLGELLSLASSERRREKDFQPELHTSINRSSKKPEFEQNFVDNLINACKERLPRCILAGVSLSLFIWKEKPGGEKLHNRYILTEKGGVSFGSGLDETDDDSQATDDLNRLSEEQYSLRWQQYTSDLYAFELISQPVEIVGTAS